MTRSEATKILAVLAAAYPNSTAIKKASPTEAEGIVSVWVMQFANMPADIVFMAVNKHISKVNYFPTISEIKEKITSVHWDAYSKISSNTSKFLSAASLEEYKRIYEATKEYKMGIYEPSLDEMMITSSKQFLIE